MEPVEPFAKENIMDPIIIMEMQALCNMHGTTILQPMSTIILVDIQKLDISIPQLPFNSFLV